MALDRRQGEDLAELGAEPETHLRSGGGAIDDL